MVLVAIYPEPWFPTTNRFSWINSRLTIDYSALWTIDHLRWTLDSPLDDLLEFFPWWWTHIMGIWDIMGYNWDINPYNPGLMMVSNIFRCLLLSVGSVHGGCSKCAKRSAKPCSRRTVDTWKWRAFLTSRCMDDIYIYMIYIYNIYIYIICIYIYII